MCSTVPRYDMTAKVYTGKEFELPETSVTEFNEKFYIAAIQKLAFNLPHVNILGNYHCRKECHDVFIPWVSLNDVLCCHDCAERVVSSFYHKIQP